MCLKKIARRSNNVFYFLQNQIPFQQQLNTCLVWGVRSSLISHIMLQSEIVKFQKGYFSIFGKLRVSLSIKPLFLPTNLPALPACLHLLLNLFLVSQTRQQRLSQTLKVEFMKPFTSWKYFSRTPLYPHIWNWCTTAFGQYWGTYKYATELLCRSLFENIEETRLKKSTFEAHFVIVAQQFEPKKS